MAARRIMPGTAVWGGVLVMFGDRRGTTVVGHQQP